MMLPNEKYLKFFPDEDVPEMSHRVNRSSCLRIGGWLVIRKIIEDYKMTDILEKYLNGKDLGLVQDLAGITFFTIMTRMVSFFSVEINHTLVIRAFESMVIQQQNQRFSLNFSR